MRTTWHAVADRRRSTTRWQRYVAVAVAGVMAVGIVAIAPGATGHIDDEPFIVGSGVADAQLVRVGPTAARLSLAPTVGVAMADYLGTLGRGESRIVDFGALETSLPPELLEQVPAVRVESVDEGSEQGDSISYGATPDELPLRIASTEQRARATTAPLGESWFILGDITPVPGLVEVSGGVAHATAGIVGDGTTRQAIGTVHIGGVKLGGGAVELQGLRWEAVQRTGTVEEVGGSFRVEGVRIAGQALPLPLGGEELGTVLAPINQALAATGLQVVPPVVHVVEGVARVTPLAVRIADSEIGREVLGPIVGLLQPIREPVAELLLESSDDAATLVLLADVLLGVFTGASQLHLELGGVSAFTEGERFDDPFAFEPVTLPAPPPPAVEQIALPPLPAQPGVPGTPGDTIRRVVRTPGEEGMVADRVVGGIRGGAMLLVGLITLMIMTGMATGDWWRIRVTRGTVPLAGEGG